MPNRPSTGHPVTSDEITPESVFMDRRSLLKGLGYLGAGALLPSLGHAAAYAPVAERADAPAWLRQKIAGRKAGVNATAESLTPYDSVSTYNNFYEFGLDKEDPADRSAGFKADPWRVVVDGLCAAEERGVEHVDVAGEFDGFADAEFAVAGAVPAVEL